MASARLDTLKSKDMTLKDFCFTYALLIESKIEHSHNDRCPKIDANYDDWKDKTTRPINATIFYYFFSANRASKIWAQMMLSAARFPSQKVKMAYMRMFN